MSENLFTYGTLQKEETQLRLFGRTLNGVADILEDYTVSSIKAFDATFFATDVDKIQNTLVPTGVCGDFVEGVVYEISAEELRLVETHQPRNFRRMKVKLKSGNEAWIFLAM